MSEHTTKQPLLDVLHDKRVLLDGYVARTAPQRRSLLNTTIIAGARPPSIRHSQPSVASRSSKC